MLKQLNPETIGLIVQGIQAAIAAAPQVESLAIKAKDFISELFSQGLISKETQDALHAHVDEICAALLAEQAPPAWTVEPDPV
jgi:hypothetical protein